MSLLSAAKDKGIELSGINLDKDEFRLFSLLGIKEGDLAKTTQLRELVENAKVTTSANLTTIQETFVDQAESMGVRLSYVNLGRQEDALFDTFGLGEDDVASKSQLRYVVKREQLRANENKLRDEQRKANGKKCFRFGEFGSFLQCLFVQIILR